ncbi:la-related protein 6-like [Pollicipes pollicipes]|uniref:la-related protein 6-like n=1 Tax=Pollicipes pollicipes TaxID=41117 RepID=UPI0018852EE7|nr:la-related protein 6-like [Pollicipes pollicipes]
METLAELAPAPALGDRRESAASSTSTDSDDCGPSLRARPALAGAAPTSDKQLLAVEEAGLSHAESSLSDCRDSGVEADAYVQPDEATALQLVEAVEFYFSDDNLLKDAFLLKHVKRNKEGFVSLKLMSSFKRVKHISRDWRVVAFAMRFSSQLEVNEEATKVRRLQPLPEHDETVTSRTVVAVNLPLENPTIASVSELFGSCGDISSIRVLKPGSNIPVEVRAAFNKHPDIAWEGVNCAVVEFDLQEQARKAKETMGCGEPTDAAAMHIIPIGKVSNKKKSRQEEPGRLAASLEEINNNANVPAEKKRRQKRKKTSLVHMDSHSSMSGTDGELSMTPMRRLSAASRPPLLPLPPGLRAHRLSPPSRPGGMFACTDIRLAVEHHLVHRGKSHSSPNVLPPQSLASRQQKSNSFCGVVPAGASDQCPWVQRRKASGMLDADRRGSLMTQDNVHRAPRGPDGTRGFIRPSRPSAITIKAPLAAAAPAPAAAPAQARRPHFPHVEQASEASVWFAPGCWAALGRLASEASVWFAPGCWAALGRLAGEASVWFAPGCWAALGRLAGEASVWFAPGCWAALGRLAGEVSVWFAPGCWAALGRLAGEASVWFAPGCWAALGRLAGEASVWFAPGCWAALGRLAGEASVWFAPGSWAALGRFAEFFRA